MRRVSSSKHSSTPAPVLATGAHDAQPTVNGFVYVGVGDLKLARKIILVQQQHVRHVANVFDGTLPQIERGPERGGPRQIGHEQESSRPAQVRHSYGHHVVFASQVPQNEVHLLFAGLDDFLVDLDTNRRQVFVGEHAMNEAGDKAGLADGKCAQHADLLLDHCSSLPAPGQVNTAAPAFSGRWTPP